MYVGMNVIRIRYASPAITANHQNKTCLIMTAPVLSLCMILRNAKNALPDCLASVKSLEPLLSDYVFVDTGSSDETQVYLRKYYPDATVLECAWQDHYAMARNQAIAAAKAVGTMVDPIEQKVQKDLQKALASINTVMLSDMNFEQKLQRLIEIQKSAERSIEEEQKKIDALKSKLGK